MDKRIQKGVLIGAALFGITGLIIAVTTKSSGKEKIGFSIAGIISGAISGGLIGGIIVQNSKKSSANGDGEFKAGGV